MIRAATANLESPKGGRTESFQRPSDSRNTSQGRGNDSAGVVTASREGVSQPLWSVGMLNRLAVFLVRRPKLVLAAVTVLFGISIVFGGTVSDKLGVGGFTDPKSESTQADEFLDQNFGTTSNLVIQIVARDGTVNNPNGV